VAALRVRGVDDAAIAAVTEEVADDLRRAAELVEQAEPLTAEDLGADEVIAHA
jgi:hypothetical protein